MLHFAAEVVFVFLSLLPLHLKLPPSLRTYGGRFWCAEVRSRTEEVVAAVTVATLAIKAAASLSIVLILVYGRVGSLVVNETTACVAAVLAIKPFFLFAHVMAGTS